MIDAPYDLSTASTLISRSFIADPIQAEKIKKSGKPAFAPVAALILVLFLTPPGSSTRASTEFVPTLSDTWIAFTAEDQGNANLVLVRPDGSGSRRITNDTNYDWSPTWSPDGTKLAFSGTDSQYHIYTINADGTNLEPLTSGSQMDQNPDWSPDGRKIAFDSDRDGIPKVYVMNFDGAGVATRLQHPAMLSTPPGRRTVPKSRTRMGGISL